MNLIAFIFRFPITALCLLAATPGIGAAGETVLEIDGSRFTVNGKAKFLLGCSYYGGLGAPEDFVRADLEDLRRQGFNWIRVWATWNAFGQDVSAVDSQGNARDPYFAKLEWLIAECDRRGMIVDVTLTRGEKPLADLAAHQTAVATLVEGLRTYRNWYLDLANERDVRDARYVPVEELKSLRDRLRQLDAKRLVTASFGGHDLEADDVRDLLVKVGADFLAPHRPRHKGSPEETGAHTRRCREYMQMLGRIAPVHYQEPFRRGYEDWNPAASDFLEDLRQAVTSGAAGWCFHNGAQRGAKDERPRRSFDLSKLRLFDQLDSEERAFLDRLKEIKELRQ
jgi:hypothetical protein